MVRVAGSGNLAVTIAGSPFPRGTRAMVRRLAQDEAGATAIEYGLIAALISIACIIAFQSLGLNLADVFMTVVEAMRGSG